MNEEILPRELTSLTPRRGKWTVEEERYTEKIIMDFENGTLDVDEGSTLRNYLSRVLNCDPMRITKKFTGNSSIGKRTFVPLMRTPENESFIEMSRKDLENLRRNWINKLLISEQWTQRKMSCMKTTKENPYEVHFFNTRQHIPNESTQLTTTTNTFSDPLYSTSTRKTRYSDSNLYDIQKSLQIDETLLEKINDEKIRMALHPIFLQNEEKIEQIIKFIKLSCYALSSGINHIDLHYLIEIGEKLFSEISENLFDNSNNINDSSFSRYPHPIQSGGHNQLETLQHVIEAYFSKIPEDVANRIYSEQNNKDENLLQNTTIDSKNDKKQVKNTMKKERNLITSTISTSGGQKRKYDISHEYEYQQHSHDNNNTSLNNNTNDWFATPWGTTSNTTTNNTTNTTSGSIPTTITTSSTSGTFNNNLSALFQLANNANIANTTNNSGGNVLPTLNSLNSMNHSFLQTSPFLNTQVNLGTTNSGGVGNEKASGAFASRQPNFAALMSSLPPPPAATNTAGSSATASVPVTNDTPSNAGSGEMAAITTSSGNSGGNANDVNYADFQALQSYLKPVAITAGGQNNAQYAYHAAYGIAAELTKGLSQDSQQDSNADHTVKKVKVNEEAKTSTAAEALLGLFQS